MKTRMGKIIAVVFVLTACSAPAPIEVTREVTRIIEQTVAATPAPPIPTEKVWTYQDMTVAFASMGLGSNWSGANDASFKENAKALGITLRFFETPMHQEPALRAAIDDEKVDVIVFDPLVSGGWDDLLREARAAGKIVILEDHRIDAPEDLYVTRVGSDFVEEGRKAGRAMVELLKDSSKKNIVELAGAEGSSAAEERAQGFREAIEGSGIVITQSRDCNFLQEEGKTVMAAFLKHSRDIQGVFAQNDEMALGAIEALKEAGLKPGVDVKIVSIDAAAGAFKAMLAGEMNVTVECSPDTAPQVYEAALKALNGETLPKFIPTKESVFSSDMPDLEEVFKTRKY